MQTFTELQDGDRIVVKKSIHKAKMLHPKTYDYFSLLRKNFAGISIHNVLVIIFITITSYVKKLRNLELCFVENLSLEFASGFNIFSGETGSGKSIIVDALAILLGKRATLMKIRRAVTRQSLARFSK